LNFSSFSLSFSRRLYGTESKPPENEPKNADQKDKQKENDKKSEQKDDEEYEEFFKTMDEAMKPFSFESLFQRLSDTTAGE
jgi:uncharacterized FlaG/YvyC family protein